VNLKYRGNRTRNPEPKTPWTLDFRYFFHGSALVSLVFGSTEGPRQRGTRNPERGAKKRTTVTALNAEIAEEGLGEKRPTATTAASRKVAKTRRLGQKRQRRALRAPTVRSGLSPGPGTRPEIVSFLAPAGSLGALANASTSPLPPHGRQYGRPLMLPPSPPPRPPGMVLPDPRRRGKTGGVLLPHFGCYRVCCGEVFGEPRSHRRRGLKGAAFGKVGNLGEAAKKKRLLRQKKHSAV
jgi:hypothetical protein